MLTTLINCLALIDVLRRKNEMKTFLSINEFKYIILKIGSQIIGKILSKTGHFCCINITDI